MRRLTSSSRYNEQSFSLVELMVTLIVFGILVAIAIPILLQQRTAAVASSIRTDVHAAVNAVKTSLVTYPNAIGFKPYYGGQSGISSYAGIAPVKLTIGSADSTNTIRITNPVADLTDPTGATGQGSAANGYQVTGTNSSTPGYYYTYNSLTGNFYDSRGNVDKSFQSQ